MWKAIMINEEPSGYYVNEDGVVLTLKKKPMKYQLDQRGYHCITIRGKKFRIHRLVAMAFIPNPENKREVNHIDGNKDNNHVSNLEWVTSSENMCHAYRTGLHPVMHGEAHPESKYTEEDIHNVCKLIVEGKTRKEISKLTGVSYTTVCDISIGKAWTRISSQYDLENSNRRKYRKFYQYIDDAIRNGVNKNDILACIKKHFSDVNDGSILNLINHRRRAVEKEDAKYLSVTFYGFNDYPERE
jgi:hypothetical protein